VVVATVSGRIHRFLKRRHVPQKPPSNDNSFAKELTYNEFYKVFVRMKLYLDSVAPSSAVTSNGATPTPTPLPAPSSSPSLSRRILPPNTGDGSDDESSECCICMERSAEVALSECNHAFCNQCLEEWTKINQSCPVCRQHAKNDDEVWILTNNPSNEDIFEEFEQFLKQM
jgi:hypothetical protein